MPATAPIIHHFASPWFSVPQTNLVFYLTHQFPVQYHQIKLKLSVYLNTNQRTFNNKGSKTTTTYIKHKRSDSNTIPPLKADGILHQDSKEKANILNKQFQMAFLTKTELSDESFKQPAT